MARPIESKLYRELVESCFQFIERGTREINEIYELVQHEFPDFCDDDYPCPHLRNAGLHQPEWKHTVRNALQRSKKRCDDVDFS
jgi:hypothetical protein